MSKTTAKKKKSEKTEHEDQAAQLRLLSNEWSYQLKRDAKSSGHLANGKSQENGSKSSSAQQLARGLGWFSIGLGVAEVVMPNSIAKLIGVRGNHSTLIRVLGLREIASGIGILSQRRPAAGVWSRVGGDAIDLALLGGAFTLPKSKRGKVVAATAAVIGVTALDVFSAKQLVSSSDATAESGAISVRQSIAINRSPEELYNFWHDFQNLPHFMKHLESVQMIGEGRSHWIAKAPAGTTVEWDAEITADQPNKLIAWRSLEGADVDSVGAVRFERAPTGHGTIVKVDMEYNPPGGVIGAAVAKLFGEDPDWQVKDDLRRFKQMLETGEIITTEGQSAGRESSTSWKFDQAVRS